MLKIRQIHLNTVISLVIRGDTSREIATLGVVIAPLSSTTD